jgi:hypothetical protein
MATMRFDNLDDFARHLDQFGVALGWLNGPLTDVHIDRSDPQSVDRAIQEVSDAIDQRLGNLARNPAVADFARVVKSECANRIQDDIERSATEDDGEFDSSTYD